MRPTVLLFLVSWGLACSGGGEAAGRDARSDLAVDDTAAPESLFGDVDGPGDDLAPADGVPPDAVSPDAVSPDTVLPDAVQPGDVADADVADSATEAVAPVEWDVLVLTAQKGHLYRNGAFHTVVQNTSAAAFVAIDGALSRYYTLTDDGQGRIDGEPAFEVGGVPGGVTFLDVAASTSTGAAGTYFFTLQSNGQVRNHGGDMFSVAPPGGQAWAAIAAEGDTFYLATTTGTLFEKNKLYTALSIPASAADPLVALRVLNGQFYALTQGGKVLKNTVTVLDLSAKAEGPFVALDVTPGHVYVLSRACKVFEDATELYADKPIVPFTGDTCAGLATIHSLD